MEMLLERLSSGQIVAVISVVSGCIVGLAMIVAIAKYQLQWLAEEAALKREKQQAKLALREKLIEHGTPPGTDLEALLKLDLDDPNADELAAAGSDLDGELAKRFGSLDLSGDQIEPVLARAMTANPSRKTTILNVMDELLGNDAPHAAILAAVRPLCATKEASPAGCA